MPGKIRYELDAQRGGESYVLGTYLDQASALSAALAACSSGCIQPSALLIIPIGQVTSLTITEITG